MNIVTRMMIVGSLLAGGTGVANAYTNTYGCPAGNGGITLYTGAGFTGNSTTFCAPTGTTGTSFNLAEYYFVSGFTGVPVRPVLTAWEGRVASWSLDETNNECVGDDGGSVGFLVFGGCSESFSGTTSQSTADACSADAGEMHLESYSCIQ